MSLFDMEESPTIEFKAVFSDFAIGSFYHVLSGVVLSGCKNTKEEILNTGSSDHFDFLSYFDDIPGPGVWEYRGHIKTTRSFEGEYDIYFVGKWFPSSLKEKPENESILRKIARVGEQLRKNHKRISNFLHHRTRSR